MNYKKRSFPLLPKDHCFSKLYATHIYDESNLVVSAIMLKIRLHIRTVGEAKLVK